VSDLTAKEQDHVRAALWFLRSRTGRWATLAKALRLSERTLTKVIAGKSVSPMLAFRAARFAKVRVDDVLMGRFPEPGTCAHCGHRAEAAE
jgi:hypothetical protein